MLDVYLRHGDECDGEESLELPVVGSVGLGRRREARSIVHSSNQHSWTDVRQRGEESVSMLIELKSFGVSGSVSGRTDSRGGKSSSTLGASSLVDPSRASRSGSRLVRARRLHTETISSLSSDLSEWQPGRRVPKRIRRVSSAGIALLPSLLPAP